MRKFLALVATLAVAIGVKAASIAHAVSSQRTLPTL